LWRKETMVPDGKAALWRLIARDADAIVPLNARREGLPFYCVHSIGGDVTSFQSLARLLGNEASISLYGIQAPKQHLSGAFAASIAHISEYYVKELISFQPQGTLVLGGWSVGSVIALEMAQQLQARGRAVELLVLFDGVLKNAGNKSGAWNPLCYWRWVGNLPRWIADDLVEGGGWRSAARRINGKLRGRSHAVDGLFDTRRWPDRQVSFMRALYDAAEAYVPQAYDGRVLFYAAKTRPLSQLAPIEAAWAKIAPAIEAVYVKGTHLNLIGEPEAVALTEDLRWRLAALRREDAVIRGDSPKALEVIDERIDLVPQ
jgi:thioesterase domain-containing protein